MVDAANIKMADQQTINPTLRPAVPQDWEFLFRLYASTRAHEVAAFGWPAAQQEAFLRMQFNAQQQWYETVYSHAEHQIIETTSQPIGRMIVSRERDAIHLVDISLLPDYRGQGIGGELIRSLINQSARLGAALRLQVLKTNPALRLYQRLGFVPTGGDQMYVHMELRPKAPE
jgi:ribosomal protein S18 acetylase RimI-like enzyme